MKLEDFDYVLPPNLIAQHPSAQRDASRLLALSRADGSISHRTFKDLPGLLNAGDTLVLNDTRVMQARLLGAKADTGGRVELLLLHPAESEFIAPALAKPLDRIEWICLGQSSKGFRAGMDLMFEGMSATVAEVLGDGMVRVRFRSKVHASMAEALARVGQLPLPPYIERAAVAEDLERYQTVYADEPGSVAAPTAGLHFTPNLLKELQDKGVQTLRIRLEVGPGTFAPVREREIERHHLHRERYSVPAETAREVARAKREGRRIIPVGTTVVRTLESAWDEELKTIKAGRGETTLFIYPGYRFNVADALITNFHLPRSSLLMLVTAFAGTELIQKAYLEAVSSRYRFYSYGDAMFIH
jgi:S-adenosylmethionine:tRNA ribosyltransferase-isomerase